MGTLNLCLEMPGTMQKESAQFDHTVRRKRLKRAEILQYFDIDLKWQNLTTFCTFSLRFHFWGADPPLRGVKPYFSVKTKKFPVFLGLLVTTLETCCKNWITFCQSDTPSCLMFISGAAFVF